MTKQKITQKKLIQTGINLIEAKQAPTFSNLARAMTIKSQAIYPYFANQIELSYAILEYSVDHLIAKLQTTLFGMAGREAIVQLAMIWRAEGLAHVHLSQFLLSLPRKEQNEVLQAKIQVISQLMDQLLKQVLTSAKTRLLASRFIRNLIVGEILNIGGGWFQNSELPQESGFRTMLELGLTELIKTDSADHKK